MANLTLIFARNVTKLMIAVTLTGIRQLDFCFAYIFFHVPCNIYSLNIKR